jgi:hypothetical protein
LDWESNYAKLAQAAEDKGRDVNRVGGWEKQVVDQLNYEAEKQQNND